MAFKRCDETQKKRIISELLDDNLGKELFSQDCIDILQYMSKKLREQTGRNISIVVLENNRADVKLVEGMNVVTSVNLDGTARKNNYSKLTEDQVMIIQSLHRDKWSIAKISKHTGIARQTIAKYLKVF